MGSKHRTGDLISLARSFRKIVSKAKIVQDMYMALKLHYTIANKDCALMHSMGYHQFQSSSERV